MSESEGAVRQADGRLVATGYAVLDGLLGGGLERGAVAVLEGDARTGKTTWALNVSWRVTVRGGNVAFIAAHETERSLRERVVSLVAGLPLADVHMGRVTAGERTRIEAARDALRGHNWRLAAPPCVDMTDIRHDIEGMHEDAPLSLIVFDGALPVRCDPVTGRETVGDQIAAMAMLHAIARHVNAPILATHTRYRASTGRLSGASIIESMADLTLELRRADPAPGALPATPALVDLVVVANRRGECGATALTWTRGACHMAGVGEAA